MKYIIKLIISVLYFVIRIIMFIFVILIMNPLIIIWHLDTSKCFGIRKTIQYLKNDYKVVFATEEPIKK